MPAAVDSVARLTPTLTPAAGLVVVAGGEVVTPEVVVFVGPPTMATPSRMTVTLNCVEFWHWWTGALARKVMSAH